MLGVRLICVGRLGEKFWAQAVKEYEKRLGAYCKLEIIELPEQRLPQTPSEGEIAQALDREAALIESRIWPGAAVIAMCVEGKTMSSEQLADYFSRLTVSGTSKICLLIGGSCGLSERLAVGGAAAVYVAHDVPASSRARYGARAGLPRAQYRRRRQVP